ncbi:hypothetical protein NBH00_11975 [Paraconexibacter antarcticus]|uniref:Uncharacterized protein n=1 Tax=Paraconexibacter antarcticus TaxID=2949664 RepID=A0ABY5E115_9ACTN|nr:hypothetical protein [Paraconexibacter antarcticus]UTI66899.1 hypothetical protein NBH00_11975 [Paraconexibacter antarcticus]
MEVLSAARKPHDRRREAAQAGQRAHQDEQTRLIGDPAALREHLREHYRLREAVIGSLSPEGTTAFELLLDATNPPDVDEAAALRDLGRELADHLPFSLHATTPPTVSNHLIEGLAAHYLHEQHAQIHGLGEAHGRGPHVRRAENQLASGALLGCLAVRRLADNAQHDERALATQRQRRAAYLQFREHEARHRAREQPLSTRLRHGPETYLDEIDAHWLRDCDACNELTYPNTRNEIDGSDDTPAYECGFCGSRELRPAGPRDA